MQQANKVLTLDSGLVIMILWITTGHLKSCSHFLVFSHMSPSYWLSRFTRSLHCTCTFFPLLLDHSCVSFPVSAHPKGVQVRPLLHVIVELTVKQISKTRNIYICRITKNSYWKRCIGCGQWRQNVAGGIPFLEVTGRKSTQDGGRSNYEKHGFRANSKSFRKNGYLVDSRK